MMSWSFVSRVVLLAQDRVADGCPSVFWPARVTGGGGSPAESGLVAAGVAERDFGEAEQAGRDRRRVSCGAGPGPPAPRRQRGAPDRAGRLPPAAPPRPGRACPRRRHDAAGPPRIVARCRRRGSAAASGRPRRSARTAPTRCSYLTDQVAELIAATCRRPLNRYFPGSETRSLASRSMGMMAPPGGRGREMMICAAPMARMAIVSSRSEGGSVTK